VGISWYIRTHLTHIGSLESFVASEGRRGGGEDPWLCDPGFCRVCLCRRMVRIELRAGTRPVKQIRNSRCAAHARKGRSFRASSSTYPAGSGLIMSAGISSMTRVHSLAAQDASRRDAGAPAPTDEDWLTPCPSVARATVPESRVDGISWDIGPWSDGVGGIRHREGWGLHHRKQAVIWIT
jgi:hypothetical protein